MFSPASLLTVIGIWGQNANSTAPKLPPGAVFRARQPEGLTMATIEKRERKTGTVYLVDIRIAGYPRQKKSFRRLTDAKAWAAKTETAIRDGVHRPGNRDTQRKTFSDVLDRYEGDVLPGLAESTQRAAQTYLKHWRAELGQYALSYLTSELISEKMRALAETPDRRSVNGTSKPKSRKTLKHYRDTLEVVLKHAKQWGWIGLNPMDGVDRITRIRNERDRYLSDEERQSLLAASRASDNPLLYPVVVFALSTGARKGEILGLTVKDIDLDRNIAILRDTKNGDTRSVPIVGHLRELMVERLNHVNALYDAVEIGILTRWVFPRRDLLAPIDIRKAWENAVADARVEDFRFHDLRHSTASYLAMQGASLLEIADMLGHKTLQMVKRYAHLSADHKQDLADRLSERLF